GEGGLGIITRKGFEVNQAPALKDANYGTLLFGAGLEYRLNGNWSLTAGLTSSPAHSGPHQPRTSFFSGGFNYTMRPLPSEQLDAHDSNDYIFPHNIIQLGYSTNALGYGVNDFVSKGAVPIFWAADVQVAHGVSATYQRNVFHTSRVFSLDWGATAASWNSE